MKVKVIMPPWCKPSVTKEFEEAVKIIGDDVWKEASIRFYAVRKAKINNGRSAPKGMQKYINEVLDEKFENAGWEGSSGYYYKERTWIRITFRHQMSLGSDFINALKVCKKEGMELAAIVAADKNTLKIISPNDAGAIISSEKLLNEMMSLDGVIDIPLVIGELKPLTQVPSGIYSEILKERPRDISIPIDNIKNDR